MVKLNPPSRWKALLLMIPLTRAETCDWKTDSCPSLFLADTVCQAGTVDGCPADTSDCLDCDPCREWSTDCGACVANDCHYCAADQMCASQPITQEVWDTVNTWSICNAEEDWAQTCEPNPGDPFSDPLYTANEWAFEMMNVKPAWEQGLTGKGVVVRVNDAAGVDASHPEFAGRVDLDASCESYEPLPNPPEGSEHSYAHGTYVASLAVGGGNNGECSVGMAPEATLSVCFSPKIVNSDLGPTADILGGIATTHISVNSWGFDACYQRDPLPPSVVSRGGGGRSLQEDDCPFEGDHWSNLYETNLVNPCQACPQQGLDLASPECAVYITYYCNGGDREVNWEVCEEYQDQFTDCDYIVLSDEAKAALARGVTEGRDGKGIIYMFAAGNEYMGWEDVNMEGWLNTRYTTLVAALDKDEKHASYSTGGAAVFVSGPGGDYTNYGVKGLMAAHPVAYGGGCGDSSFGTSFATPMVSGAIALVLEANPELSWRDVQGILASTARKVDIDDPSWTTNGAKLHHSNLYGFGVMDVAFAVEVAKSWTNFGPEKEVTMDSGVINLAIANDPTATATTSVTVAAPMSTTVENVAVLLQLEHSSRGDVEVVLTSPAGTKSVLHPGLRRENIHPQAEDRWELLTVRNYGENTDGEWTLSLTDKRVNSIEGCVDIVPFKVELDVDGVGRAEWGCDALQSDKISNPPFCFNGTMSPAVEPEFVELRDETTGKNALESCCNCGGGLAESPVAVNQLVSWQLVIYGHERSIFESDKYGSSDNSGSSGGISKACSFASYLALAALFAAVA